MDVDELALNCWFRSEDPEQSFQVNIPKTATVYDLQKAIKNKNPAAFRDIDAFAPRLYKPKVAVSEPFKENLSKLVLSEHGEFLHAVHKLYKIFPEPPPKRDIHVIVVDAPLTIVCWLRGADLKDCFRIPIQPGETIYLLISRIKDALPKLRDNPIRIYKISGDESELRECLNKTGGGELLQSYRMPPLAREFLDVPVLDPLRVVIEASAMGGNSRTLVQETIPRVDYRGVFLRVKDWGKLEEDDIQRNLIKEDISMRIPAFVTTFEQKLLRKPRLYLPFDARMRTMGISEEYFEPHQASTAEDSREGIRRADPLEVTHTLYHIVPYDWQLAWQHKPLNEPIMASIFFNAFFCGKNGRNIVWRGKPWPFDVVVKCENDTELRQYRPRSDFLITNSNLPRLLVKVDSAPATTFPKDLRWMLATGAFVVRFANKFVSTFSQEKNFVLCAFFIFFNGTAARYTLFQIPNDETVYYRKKYFRLNDQLGRVEFARHLYNLHAELDQSEDQAAMDAVRKFREEARRSRMKSMYIKSETDCTESDDDDPSEGDDPSEDDDPTGGNGYTAQLRAHGYKVEPKVIVDDSGGTWEPIYKTPDHILTVYRPTNRKKMFIAKKAREDSDELKILKLLDTIRPKSDHVISLVDSFDGWAILPKMATVQGHYLWSEVFESKVPKVCLGLVKGLAYLHEHRIAHRDIKLDNLLVDENFTLKIIDFGLAMKVENEDEEVDDQCGTPHWMAPEVEKKLRHSPIKADRWSCGRVILSLLDRFRKEDKPLRAFARDLIAYDPKQRPSLLEWGRYLAPPFSGSGNIENSDAALPRQDRMEVDEDMRPSNAKKPRLE